MTHLLLTLLLASQTHASAAAPRALAFDIDPDHSSVGFRIRHLVGRVQGRFNRLSGKFSGTREDPKTWKAEAVIDAASIDTGVAARDEHLRGPDFFDAARCPSITFVSKGASAVAKNTAKLQGLLTLRCVTKPVALDLESDGTSKDPWGKFRAGVTARARIDRKDFGMVFNKVLDNGGTLLGDEVEITIYIEGIAP